MELHQIIVSASPGDAVTNAAFEIQALLQKIGPSEIFSRYIDERLKDEILPLQHYPQLPSAKSGVNFLIYHAAIGEPEVASFLLNRPERLILLYHNISPPEAFLPYDPAFAGLLQEGRRELRALRHRVTLALAVSAYNASELRGFGYPDVHVSPLILDLSRMQEIKPDAKTVEQLDSNIDGPMILFVGQILPHKRPDLLIRAYHAMITYLLPEAHLFLVGATRSSHYRLALKNFLNELNLERAQISGEVSLEQLVAFYKRADVFVTFSEHEGFCIPLIEAMAFDLPIVARRFAAIPETLGDSGLLLPPIEDSLLAAEAISTILSDSELRDDFIARGRKRLKNFEPENAKSIFLEHLTKIL